MPGYVLAVFALSTLPPLALYLKRELGAAVPAGAGWLSPFWVAAADGPAAWVQASLAGLAGLALLIRKETAP